MEGTVLYFMTLNAVESITLIKHYFCHFKITSWTVHLTNTHIYTTIHHS